MTDEEWRPIPGWPDYRISNVGRVLSLRQGEPRPLRPQLVGSYHRVHLFRVDGHRLVGVHQLVAAAFIGPCPDGQQVRHLDGDPLNNVPANLAYGTHADNMQDRLRHGRHPMASKTHCKRGHEFTAANTLRYRGSRFCRKCRTARRLKTATP
jgi:hypothetical protein